MCIIAGTRLRSTQNLVPLGKAVDKLLLPRSAKWSSVCGTKAKGGVVFNTLKELLFRVKLIVVLLYPDDGQSDCSCGEVLQGADGRHHCTRGEEKQQLGKTML